MSKKSAVIVRELRTLSDDPAEAPCIKCEAKAEYVHIQTVHYPDGKQRRGKYPVCFVHKNPAESE